jgi:hypothetical protein
MRTSSLEVSIMHEAVPQAAAIWMILLLAVALAVALMAVPRKLLPGPPRADPPPAETGHLRSAAEADYLRYAAEAAAAADRAAVLADRRRAEWQEAAAEVDAAWVAYQEADAEARRCTAATAYPVMRRRRARTENADRERYLHRAATAACRRREISIKQLNEALAHRGWNPRLHPAAQEAALRCAVREHRLAGYTAATERERRAWAAAEEAADQLRILRAEACAAALGTAAVPPAAAEWTGEQTTTEPARTPALEPARTLAAESARTPAPEPVRIPAPEPVRAPVTDPVRTGAPEPVRTAAA